MTAQLSGFQSSEWATFKQWQEQGAQVRKGEKGTPIVFYKNLEIADADKPEGQGEDARTIPFARASWVFNAAQVDGLTTNPDKEPPAASLFERLGAVEKVIAATGAYIEYGGAVACYRRREDKICIPDPSLFIGSPTMTAQEALHATELHELVHWSGAEHRLNREKGGKFADRAYSFEEMVAELGAAFLCAELGVSNEPRADHAQYIAHFLTLLKDDKRAIFHAATAASAASEFILAFSRATANEEAA